MTLKISQLLPSMFHCLYDITKNATYSDSQNFILQVLFGAGYYF